MAHLNLRKIIVAGNQLKSKTYHSQLFRKYLQNLQNKKRMTVVPNQAFNQLTQFVSILSSTEFYAWLHSVTLTSFIAT